jgi:hypothetical protein
MKKIKLVITYTYNNFTLNLDNEETIIKRSINK